MGSELPHPGICVAAPRSSPIWVTEFVSFGNMDLTTGLPALGIIPLK